MAVVQGIAEQKKPTFLSGEQKYQAHHHSESCLIKVLLAYTFQKAAVLLDIDAVKSLNQYLDRLQYLLTELVGDFLLIQRALRKHVRKCLVLCYTKETTNSE
ncbi:hypothetical protein AQ730_10770 [Burkholderia pseudomallei]|nr:hypothetical protein AQ730_10770 [Burkholderia pseudomallei]